MGTEQQLLNDYHLDFFCALGSAVHLLFYFFTSDAQYT